MFRSLRLPQSALRSSLPSFQPIRLLSTPALQPLSAAKLTIEKTADPKPLKEPHELVFGHTFTDHMLAIEWNSETGWDAPKITPYQNLSLDPATCVFHYGFECFEGMKAYKDANGDTRIFRGDRNMSRFNNSATRIALPTFDGEELLKAIAEFVKVDDRWVPRGQGYSLYLRPTLIGTQKTLGIGPTSSALLYVIASPVGPYYPTGFKAVSLWATTDKVRAWPGGFGNAKLGANYAPCVAPQVAAAQKGYHQNLWLFGEENYVTEVGTMNCFTAWVNEDGVKELITAPTTDGTILEGVTRDSVLDLARERLVPQGWAVSEKKYTMDQIKKAADEGRLLEMFGTGTAATCAPIKRVHYKGEDISVPLQPGKEAGPVAEQMQKWIMDIQYGVEEHKGWARHV
ncbi:branched-chain amino acid transaminase [Saitoella complicata NRRL Y-17804]|nr:branched-chain amino acid transaminase [Saitoella complicata NRRL Y-17804]ODQ56034.1 branched-chain amino acid transaminase [Saitoella complicata NRRL Y-17804]